MILLGILTTALVVGVSLGIWRFVLSAPRYYSADGTTMWKHQMKLVEQSSAWPYVTKYTADWNSVSMTENGETIASSRWIEFALWNGHGIDDVKVYELDGKDERLVYPSEKEARSLSHTSDSGPFAEMSLTYGTTDESDKYVIFGVAPPAGGIKNLRIVVTDVHGNVTSDVMDVASIEE